MSLPCGASFKVWKASWHTLSKSAVAFASSSSPLLIACTSAPTLLATALFARFSACSPRLRTSPQDSRDMLRFQTRKSAGLLESTVPNVAATSLSPLAQQEQRKRPENREILASPKFERFRFAGYLPIARVAI